ncbi:MAG: hypothetical protein FI707_08410 [SAR202 cluster bacterium]|jgi:hypothetical protein|nr:DUF5667 domain-containing protein [SAR202 cluster bacterium]HAL47178.1 hypothetical protein [Dehalococcoidia bacterium]MDP6665694.1 DUF5667 domain-containing protein [SAR202 cluster bacterium]MDP6798381.1 DUF5667 domain-containing protein [SAR202 cluster bacterium]MQG59402.1 hypothetical protein [SAR202 cluster bacterium]|tara:strand:+ start:322 stop:1239 length:918 start_codon:yes stop_codon:yes gene_type:complete
MVTDIRTGISKAKRYIMSQEFNEALNDCLERISGGEDLLACLNDYPRHRDDLESLIKAASATSNLASAVAPSEQSKQRNFQQFTHAMQTAGRQPGRWTWLSARWLPVARPVAISLAVLVVLVTGAGVTTAASSDSIPGEPLYWVKSAKESIQVRLPRSDDGKAQAYADLAAARGKEMQKLVAIGRYADAESAIKRMNQHLQHSAVLVGVNLNSNPVEMPAVRRRSANSRSAQRLQSALERDNERMRAEFQNMLNGLPPVQRQRALFMVRQSELGYRMLIDAMKQRGAQSGLPFIYVQPPQGVAGQ